MTAEQIAKKYVHGLHNALTDKQEIKDMMTDIEAYAENYHQAKLKKLRVADVIKNEVAVCDNDCGGVPKYCEKCYEIESQFRQCY